VREVLSVCLHSSSLGGWQSPLGVPSKRMVRATVGVADVAPAAAVNPAILELHAQATNTSVVSKDGKELNLSEERIAEFNEAFQLFDKDGSGSISIKELTACMESLGQSMSEEDIREAFNEMDKDGSGEVDFLEFCQFMAGRMNDVDDPELLRVAFEIFDSDHSGGVTKAEVMEMIKDIMKNTGESLPEAEVDAMIAEADKDGDGQIDCEEFMKVMRDW